jgi:hypothetical protein
MLTYIIIVLLFGVAGVVAWLMHNDIVAKHERLVNRLLADRQAAMDETKALRAAIIPTVAKAQEASKPPATRDEMIAAIWADHRMSTREKLRRLQQLANSQQRTRDQIAQMAEAADEHQKQLDDLAQKQEAARAAIKQMAEDTKKPPTGGHHQSNY